MTTIKEDNIYRWVAPNEALRLIFPFAPLAPFTMRCVQRPFSARGPFFIFFRPAQKRLRLQREHQKKQRVARRLSSQAEQNMTRDKFFLSLMPRKVCTQQKSEKSMSASMRVANMNTPGWLCGMCVRANKKRVNLSNLFAGASERVIKSDSSCAAGSNCNSSASIVCERACFLIQPPLCKLPRAKSSQAPPEPSSNVPRHQIFRRFHRRANENENQHWISFSGRNFFSSPWRPDQSFWRGLWGIKRPKRA